MTALALDIESYGAVEKNLRGDNLPPQTQYHPRKCMEIDHVRYRDLIQTVSLTKIEGCPSPARLPEGRALWLAGISPGETMVFNFGEVSHRRMLLSHLSKATILLGHHLSYDLLFLRFLPRFRRILRKQLIIDNSVLNYLFSEVRPERTQKNIAVLLGTHQYKRTLKEGRFPDPITLVKGHSCATYCAQDTHTSVHNAARLAADILERHPNTDKLSPYCIRYFSDCIWCCVLKAEAGVAMSLPILERISHKAECRRTYTRDAAAHKYGLKLGGKNSQASQSRFIDECIAEVPHVYPLLEKTPTPPRRLSWSKTNREILLDHLPTTSPRYHALRLAQVDSEASKLLTSYTRKLLTVQLIRKNRDVGLAYPNWRCVPTPTKDETDDAGGQKQCRPSASDPGVQTFPPIVRTAYRSRYPHGVLTFFDCSQHELRTAAAISGDEYLVDAYRLDLDLHTERAKQIFDEDVESSPTFRKLERQCGKHANFTDLNRGGWKILRATIYKKGGGLVVSEEFCREIVSSRRKQRAGLMEWQDSLLDFARQHHHIALPFTGHTRVFLPGTKYLDNQIVNFPIQGCAACAVWAIEHRFATHHLTEAEPRHLFLNVYDAIVVDNLNMELAKQTVADLQCSMQWVATNGYWAWLQDKYGNTVPMKGDIKLMEVPNA